MTEEEAGREVHDSQNFRRDSDRKRSRDAQPVMISGVQTARRCAVLGAEAWDVLRAENAKTAGRIPRRVRRAVPASVGYVNSVECVVNGPHFTARMRTRTLCQLEPGPPSFRALIG